MSKQLSGAKPSETQARRYNCVENLAASARWVQGESRLIPTQMDQVEAGRGGRSPFVPWQLVIQLKHVAVHSSCR